MKKRLRLLAWLITLTMLCQLLPFSAFAQSDIAQTLVQRRGFSSSPGGQKHLCSGAFLGGAEATEGPAHNTTAEQPGAHRSHIG